MKKLKRRFLRYFAIAALFLSEIVVAGVAGGIAAAFLLPWAYQERGGWAVGGEWGLILAAAVVGYIMYHQWLFQEPERSEYEREHRRERRSVRAVPQACQGCKSQRTWLRTGLLDKAHRQAVSR